MGSKTTTTNSTPTNPDWVTNSLQGYTQGVNNIAASDPSQYVAPEAANQNLASSQAAGLSGNPNNDYSIGATMAQAGGNTPAPQATATNTLGGIQQYINAASPYVQNVEKTSLQNFDQNAGATNAATAAKAALNGAFSGSRYGVQQGVTAGQQALARSTTDANILNTGYQQAQSAAQGDADRNAQVSIANAGLGNDQLNRQVTAGGVLGTLGTAQGNLANQNINSLSSTGATDRSVAGDQADAPLTLQSLLGSLYSQGQQGLFKGTDTTQQTSGGIGDILSAIGSGAGLLSAFGSGGDGGGASSMFNSGGQSGASYNQSGDTSGSLADVLKMFA